MSAANGLPKCLKPLVSSKSIREITDFLFGEIFNGFVVAPSGAKNLVGFVGELSAVEESTTMFIEAGVGAELFLVKDGISSSATVTHVRRQLAAG